MFTSGSAVEKQIWWLLIAFFSKTSNFMEWMQKIFQFHTQFKKFLYLRRNGGKFNWSSRRTRLQLNLPTLIYRIQFAYIYMYMYIFNIQFAYIYIYRIQFEEAIYRMLIMRCSIHTVLQWLIHDCTNLRMSHRHGDESSNKKAPAAYRDFLHAYKMSLPLPKIAYDRHSITFTCFNTCILDVMGFVCRNVMYDFWRMHYFQTIKYLYYIIDHDCTTIKAWYMLYRYSKYYFLFPRLFSSPEPRLLKVSYCDRFLLVVCRP